MKLLSTALLAATAILAAAPALADTATYTLTTTNPFVVPGTTVTFNGTITAPSANTGAIYILGDSIAQLDSPLTLDDTDFFADTPSFLNPGGSYSGPLFTITLPSSTFAGIYNGTFDVIFSDSNSNEFQDNASFQVTATPEPGSWLLLSTGLAGVAALRRRYTRA